MVTLASLGPRIGEFDRGMLYTVLASIAGFAGAAVEGSFSCWRASSSAASRSRICF
jgi:hypothetical protein